MASPRFFNLLTLLVLITFSLTQVLASNENRNFDIKPSSSPFGSALETLQKQINYSFSNIGFLRRAMTHPSFSQENNRALSVLGGNVIDTYASLFSLKKNIDISSKELNHLIAEISNVESSCAVDGMRLGLDKVVRVSYKTNSTAPAVVCGAFRAIFGAIAVDTGKSDYAGSIFWAVHRRNVDSRYAFAS